MLDRLLTTVGTLLPLQKVLRAGGKIALEIALGWIVYLLVRRAISLAVTAASGRIVDEARRQRAATLVLLAGSVARYAMIFLVAIMVLRDLGMDPYPLLTAAGIAGLAVGFGAQNLVRDVVSGFFIIIEGQYAVGDLVEINGVFGRVEEVGLRITRLRDAAGQLRYFPNGAIVSANNYVDGSVPYQLTVALPHEVPPDPGPLVAAVLADFDREFRVWAQPPRMGACEELPTYARVLRAELRVRPGRQGVVEQRLPARLAGALDRAGLPLPPGGEVGLTLRLPGGAP